MKNAYDSLAVLQLESMELTSKLRTQLARLETQKKVLLDLLETGPDVTAFPTAAIKLRVGEQVFHTSLSTLTRDPTSMLAVMFSGKFALHKDDDGCIFIDRDGSIFASVLYFLRTSRLPPDLPRSAYSALLLEAEFYGLSQLCFLIKQTTKLQEAEVTF